MEESADNAWLTPREVTRRTGLSPATLRIWEQRYDFPRPERLPSGHRRYPLAEVERLEEVQRERAAGRSLPAAIELARNAAASAEDSIYAGLRRRRPDLIPYLLAKRTLIALAHAMEDEFCARGERGVLFGAFQQERFYRHAEPRWRELARTAETAVALADFPQVVRHEAAPWEVPIDRTAPVGREWSLVCEGSDYSACLTAWERPGQETVADPDRLFETVWTVEPQLVREAGRIAAGIVSRRAPELGAALEQRLVERALSSSADRVGQVTALTSRMVAYLAGNGDPNQLRAPHS
jgi:DICT domain-containing protein/predicted DNA-binding transcriptional regulator AlpA